VDCVVPSGSHAVLRRPLVVDVECVLVDVIIVRMMQMPVVQVVDVIAMAHSHVPAAGAVGVGVIFVYGAGHDSDHTPEARRAPLEAAAQPASAPRISRGCRRGEFAETTDRLLHVERGPRFGLGLGCARTELWLVGLKADL
jgi:hypothetical protein